MILIKRNKNKIIKGKWDVVNTKLNTHDVSDTFKDALKDFFWYLGLFKRKFKIIDMTK